MSGHRREGERRILADLCSFPLPAALPARACVTQARNGEKSLTLGNKFVHSAFDPSREAEKIVSAYAGAEAGVLIGYGLGYLPAAWMRARPRPLLVIELIPELLAEPTRNEEALTLAPFRCISAAGGMADVNRQEAEAVNFFRGLSAAQLKNLAWMTTPGIAAQEPALTEAARLFLKKTLENFLSNMYTELEFERLWFRNILHNAFLVPRAGRFAALCGVLKESSVVLIGAGPSLDSEIGALRLLRPHAVLMACDTALASLLEAGIVPHIVVSLDGQIHNFHDFCGFDTSEIVLLSDIAVYPAIPRLRFAGVYFFETAEITEVNGRAAVISHPLTLRVKQLCGELGVARSGGNVGTTALELARVMGAKVIILSGMDYAYPGRMTHARLAPAMLRCSLRETRTYSAPAAMRRILAKRALITTHNYKNQEVQSDIILRKYADWTAAAYAEAKEQAGDAPAWHTLSWRGMEIPGVRPIDAAAAQGLSRGHRPPAELPFLRRGGALETAAEPRAEDAHTAAETALTESMRELALEVTRVLESAPLPDLDKTLALFARYPYLRRGYGAQVLHAEKTGEYTYLLGEVRFQLQRILRILKRHGVS